MSDIIRLGDVKESLNEGFERGYTAGQTTYIPALDNHFRWMFGHVIVFFGIMNYGKSTVMNQLLLLQAIENGSKFAFWTPEFAPVDFFYLDLMHTLIGKSPYHHHRRNKMSRAEFEYAKNFVHDHFFYLKHSRMDNKPEDVNERFKRVIGEYGVNTVVTDPFNKLDLDFGMRDDKLLSKFYNGETTFAQDEKVRKIIVMHTNASVQKDDDGDYKCPKVFDVAGGAMTGNKVDDIVVVHRPRRNSDPADTTVIVESLKIKKQMLCGRPGEITMTFDVLRNRLMVDGVDIFEKTLRLPL